MKKSFLTIFLNLFSTFLIFDLYSTEFLPSPILKNFTSDNINKSFSKIIMHNNTIFVGGKNEIYKLTSDLQLMQKWVGEKCEEDSPEKENEIKVLLVFRSTVDLLVSCGTACRGRCKIHSLDNINKEKWIGDFNDTLSYVASRETTVAFFAPGPFNLSNVLYSASTYDNGSLDTSPVSVSSKALNVSNKKVYFVFSHSSETSSTSVNFHKSFKKRYIVKYLYGFSHGGFSYFVTQQRVSLESQEYETRLARVCQQDTQFFTYTEVPLKCQRGLDNYKLATTAYFGPVGNQLKKRMNLDPEKYFLYVAFSATIPLHGTMIDRTKGSVVCSFPMSQIISFFTNTTRNCFRGEPKTRLLKVITGVDTACTKKNKTIDDNFCEPSPFNHYIEAVETLPGGFRTHVEKQISSLAVTLQKDKTIAVLGTHDGHVIKVVLERRSDQPLYTMQIADKNQKDLAIRSSNAFDKDHINIYFLSGNKVLKFPIGSCSVYTKCSSCLVIEDPLNCFWCGSHCAHYEECETPSSQKAASCPPVIYTISPLMGPIQGGTLITIEGDNFSESQSGPHAHISVVVADIPCKIISWKLTSVQCRTGYVDQERKGPVTLNVSDGSWTKVGYDMNGTATSTVMFHYVVPKLYYISPTFGPVSGGTNVTLVGEKLNIGSNQQVLLSDIDCSIFSVTETKIYCTSGPSSTSIKGFAKLNIDNVTLFAQDSVQDRTMRKSFYGKTFNYLRDPRVYNVTPHAATVSGGTNITVIGVNLNSIANPQMVVTARSTISDKKMEFVKDCYVDWSTGHKMACPIPSLKDSFLFSEVDSSAPVTTYISFIMDGVLYFREFYKNNRELSLLRYFHDPEYYIFDEPNNIKIIPRDVSLLDIKGKYLNLAHRPQDVKVIIHGMIYCNVTSLTFDTLECMLPSSTLTSNDTKTSVEVIAGGRKFRIGYIQFVDTLTQNNNILYAIIIPIVFVIMLILIVIVFICKKRSQKSFHSDLMVAYSAEPDSREGSCRRRQGANDYLDMRGRTNAAMNPVTPTLPQTYQVDDETVHLLHAENIFVFRDYLTLGNVIGQGHFGRVYKGELHLPGKEDTVDVAVKTLHNSAATGEDDVRSFLQEGLMMKDFHHHNVLTLIGVCFEADGSPMVIIPYMKFGDLLSYIRNENHLPTVKDLLQYGVQIASGMKYLSELKFVHRDLAARNCMLDEDHTVKVADFGLSRDIYERDYYSSDNKKTKLPVKWMAPESLEKGTYNTKTDVWSYGVVLWELMTRGVTPYPDVDNWDILQYLKKERRMPQPSYCPDLLYTIMLHCWNEDPKKRPTFSELEEEVQGVITKLEQKSKQRRVGLNVTYVNYPSALGGHENEIS